MTEQNDHQLDIDQLANSFSPIVVTAPTARNGITLIQRLLNSTRQTIIFGENVRLVETLPQVAHEFYVMHDKLGDELQQSRQKFLSGVTEYWSSNLWPDIQRCTLVGFEMFYKLMHVYQQSAREYGFTSWGIKNPMNNLHMVRTFPLLVKPARFVFIYRNPFDVVASAKARRFVTNEQGVIDYVKRWAAHLQAVRDDPPTHTFLLRYETLMASPEAMLNELQTFTGLSGIDRGVLDRKINTFEGTEDQGRGPNEYIAPKPLTDSERELIVEHAGEMLTWAGYESMAETAAARV
jgi:hypothetical protein